MYNGLELTDEELSMLKGEQGEGRKKAMELLVGLGRIFGAKRMVRVRSVQISGISYKTIGDAGLELIRDFSSFTKVFDDVAAVMNPAGMDLEAWKEMGIPEVFAMKQLEIVGLLKAMGVQPLCTCTPYHAGSVPHYGEHIAWAESSAVIYANSVFGARTNREGGPSALAAAITARTPEYGLHIDNERVPTAVFDLAGCRNLVLNNPHFTLTVLGYLIGKKAGGGVPYITGLADIVPRSFITSDMLKAMGAGMAASGAVALYHFEGITPEWAWAKEQLEKASSEANKTAIYRITEEELLEANKQMRGNGKQPELIAFGCPHLSNEELEKIAHYLEGKRRINPHIRFWVFTSRAVGSRCTSEIETIRRFGNVFFDTCMVVSPVETLFKTIGVDSSKAYRYIPTLGNVEALLRPTEEWLKMIAE
ncbi:MAG: aconitase X catalytic domain-containing protein [Thermoplasmata archaeon]